MKTAILLMSYGSPETMDEVMPYLAGIYHGRPVPGYAVEENTRKYAMVNGISPSTAIMNSLLDKMNISLEKYDAKAFLANKHWKPWLQDVIPAIASTNAERIVGLPIFPFKSENVRSSYLTPLMEAASKTISGREIEFINGFSENPMFVKMWKNILKGETESNENMKLVFSAHSLPTENNQERDYEEAFMKASEEIARSLGIDSYITGFQSRGRYGNTWLGPSLEEACGSLKAGDRLLVAPIGFCYEHMEVLYDLDREFASFLSGRGIGYKRSHLPDDSKDFVKLLMNMLKIGAPMRVDDE